MIEQVREAALEMDKIAARKRMSLDQRSLSSRNPSATSDPGHSLVLRHKLAMQHAHRRSLESINPTETSEYSMDSEMDGSLRHSQDTSREPSAQLLGGLPEQSRLRTQVYTHPSFPPFHMRLTAFSGFRQQFLCAHSVGRVQA